MFVNEDVLARGKEKEALFAFFHSQRTGGSTMTRWFQSVFGKENVFARRTVPNWVAWDKIDDIHTLDGFRLFSGFAYFKKIDFGRPVVPISMVRHPFYRIVSLYKMSRSHDHFMHDFAKQATFEEFYREGSARRYYYFNNLICRRIATKPNADAAMEIMRKHFGVVGLTNHLPQMTAFLLDYFGWQGESPPQRKIIPDEVNYASFVREPIFTEIMERNSEDFRLFEYVSKQKPASIRAQPPKEVPTRDLLRRLVQ